ncbi:hypothetical protein OZX62_01025 [Bifidobacterium sp. ESL0690]|uniref:hypothetical protein n=1 Tax=Bifidobacterium sp. ESL0690 TaxID=2983214 RepID=UPI0023F90BD8|nr:hypothetical protein [Bifidobacterium sp. ESL0690]WEV46912.1 hypothetical protein OZX62_01025 [Bifidobacterium sp. ESL0690]
MGFIYQIVVVTFLVAFIFLAVEVVATLCHIGIRDFVKAVEDKIVYYPRAASVLAFFKIPDFLLALLTVFAVWFLQENKLSGFIRFHDDTSVEKSLFTLAISADIGLTALLSLAITFLHSFRSADESSMY